MVIETGSFKDAKSVRNRSGKEKAATSLIVIRGSATRFRRITWIRLDYDETLIHGPGNPGPIKVVGRLKRAYIAARLW